MHDVERHLPAGSTVLLSAVVGSRAHGRARADSDTDRFSVFALDAAHLFSTTASPASVVTSAPHPDHAAHELAKFAALALRSNPGCLEALWVDGHERLDPLGAELVAMRTSFASAGAVTRSYRGAAMEQMRRSSALDPVRRAKARTHALRLALGGGGLHTTGALAVTLADPDLVARFAAAEDHDRCARRLIDDALEVFGAPGALPERPDVGAVDAFVVRARLELLARESAPGPTATPSLLLPAPPTPRSVS